MTTKRGLTRIERRRVSEEERDKPCECRSCTELKYIHVDVHLKNNQPSPYCYQCRTDFAEELLELEKGNN